MPEGVRVFFMMVTIIEQFVGLVNTFFNFFMGMPSMGAENVDHP